MVSLGGGRETEGGERADTALDCLGDAPADDNGDDTNDDGCARRFRCGRGLRTSGDEVSTLGAPNFDSPPTARRPRRREPLFLSGDGSASIRGRDFFENRGGGGFRSLGGVSSDLELTPMRSSRDGPCRPWLPCLSGLRCGAPAGRVWLRHSPQPRPRLFIAAATHNGTAAPQEGSGSEVAVGVLLEAPAPPRRQYVRESQGVAAFYELWQARQERCASCACAVELLHLLWRALESRNSSNHPIIITASPYRVAQLFDPVRAQNTDSSPSSALALSTRDWGWGRSADRGTCGAMVSSEQNTGTSGGGATTRPLDLCTLEGSHCSSPL